MARFPTKAEDAKLLQSSIALNCVIVVQRSNEDILNEYVEEGRDTENLPQDLVSEAHELSWMCQFFQNEGCAVRRLEARLYYNRAQEIVWEIMNFMEELEKDKLAPLPQDDEPGKKVQVLTF